MSGSKMKMKFIIIIIIIIMGQEGCWWREGEGCLEQEKSALLHLKLFFNHPHSLTDWVEGGEDNSNCCVWEGVECSNTTIGRVIRLHLDDTRSWESAEYWYLNASLFTPFHKLESLDLGLNKIAGCVENEGLERLSELRNLKVLNLSRNSFNNSIFSSLAAISSLTELDLNRNNLEGRIDITGLERLSELSNLKVLDLSNGLFNNSIFAPLAALSSLTELYLINNLLEGSIDVTELDSLSNLEELYISRNQIDNLVVPKERPFGLSNLKVLDLGFNRLKGSINITELDSFINLESLDLSKNEIDNLLVPKDFKGLRKLNTLGLRGVKIRDGNKLLQSIVSFPSLKTLDLSDNNSTESLVFGQGWNKLETLYLSSTKLNRSFFSSLTNLSSLKTFRLYYIELDGNFDVQGVCELVHLQELYMTDSDFSGSLPRCLANMTSLRVLDVSSNQFSGNISSSSPFIYPTSIEDLTLSYNHFQIPISLEPFYNLSKLKRFDGSNNQIFLESESHSLIPKFQLTRISLSGDGVGRTFPKFLYHQHDLEYVDLSHINLGGEFPNWLLENNTNLQYLALANNSLSGIFGKPIHPHQSLLYLDISNNKFQGQIPIEIGDLLPSLSIFNISNNAFNSSIPSSFGDMNKLEFLDLSSNQLTGEIPEYLVLGCSSLRGLYLGDNHLSGKIPRWLGNLTSLERIIMRKNHLDGPIPREICQLHILEIVDISDNKISGTLPSCFNPPFIRQVHLSKNKLHGRLEEGTFFNSSSLKTLDLSYNRLNGSIPYWIESLSQLVRLILAHNNLEGEVPIQLCRLNKMLVIDLSHNNLFGPIPACLANTTIHAIDDYADGMPIADLGSQSVLIDKTTHDTFRFTTKDIEYTYQGEIVMYMSGIDVSCNRLFGEIPPQIGNLTRIHTLNLSHNNLTGSIPSTFSNLKQVESLDLSYNKLHGKIPHQLLELNFLSTFSVAHNNLSGRIPKQTAQFGTFNESSYEGNPLLCGLPLPKSCNDNGPPVVVPDASTSNENDDSLIDMESFYITFTTSYVIVILGIVGVLYVNPHWRRRWFYFIETCITSCYYFVVDNLIPTRFCC